MADNSITTVTASTGKWFAGWFVTFSVLYFMADIPSLADLAATGAIAVMIGAALTLNSNKGK